MRKDIGAKYCPNCGKPVKKSYILTFEEDKNEMRKVSADRENRCAIFYATTTLSKEEDVDFSELGRRLKANNVIVFVHKNED